MKKKIRIITSVFLILLMTAGTMCSYGYESPYNVPADWAVPEVNAAQSVGIDIGNMMYESSITRLQFAQLIYRMIEVKDRENSAPEEWDYDAPEDSDYDTPGDSGSDTPDSPGNNDPGYNPGDSDPGYIIDSATEDANRAGRTATAEDNPVFAASNQYSGYPSPFTDTDDDAVTALYYMGIVKGMTTDTYGPYENLTREQGAAILVRVSKYYGFANPNGTPAVFYDGGLMGDWARQDIKYISGHRTPGGGSIMGGYNNEFNPKGTYSVQEAILSVYRLYTSLDMPASTDASWKTMTGRLFSKVTLSAAGDCTLGRDIGASYSSSLDEVYDRHGGDASVFFRNVSEFFSDDITIVNFEGTITDASAAASKTFRFKGRKEYTNILTSGSIDVVNIANNHSHDYMDKGFSDTLYYLGAAGIGCCGYDYVCVKEVNGIKYGFYGLAPMGNGLTDSIKKSINANIKALKAQGAQYIVGSFHWGVEKSYTPTAAQKSIAHYAIDCGTDLVLGHHPHVLQNTEGYNGVQIVYSLGNFCFGGNRNPSDKDTVVFRETAVFDVETGQIVSRERNFVPYRLSSVTSRNDYQPVPVYGNEADRIKKKLWVS